MEKRKLPNANAVLILGIVSILTCCCYGVVGLVLGIVALILAKKDIALYNENPELYEGYSNINTGRYWDCFKRSLFNSDHLHVCIYWCERDEGNAGESYGKN